MELQTVSQVSKAFGISTRMLRYYEQNMLIKSLRKEDYSYRVYDEENIKRLQQIVILRKLQIPIKQINIILNNPDAATATEIFNENIKTLQNEITALETIKLALEIFFQKIEELAAIRLNMNLLTDDSVMELAQSLSLTQKNVKENKTMEELNRASENVDKLADKDIRIIHLPSMTIAAACATGEDCEGKASDMIKQFVKESNLLTIKPDARNFGFDCSQECQGIGMPSQRYEVWVSIPDDMNVPVPLRKLKFDGGLYAAHVLRAWDFEDWRRLREWVNTSEKYDNDWGSIRWTECETNTGQGFEETLNYLNLIQNPQNTEHQLYLLFPISLHTK